MLLLQVIKRPQTHSNDLHSILYSTFPEVPFQLAERQLPSPFLTITHHPDLFETRPQQWGRFFGLGSLLEDSPWESNVGTAALGCPLGTAQVSRSPTAPPNPLENSPHKVREQGEQQQHEHPADPEEEVRRQLR
jgi:hypothetical protein